MTEQQIIHWISQQKKAQPTQSVAKLACDFLAANRITVNDPDFKNTHRAAARLRTNHYETTPYAWRETFGSN